jgi:hypothetical protein
MARAFGDAGVMKASDDYRAKIRMWAAAPRVVPPAPGPRLPPFRAQRFASHEAMNRWKAELLRELARSVSFDG